MYKYAIENFGRNVKKWHWKILESIRITVGGGKARELESVGQKSPIGYEKFFEKKFFDFENFEIKI